MTDEHVFKFLSYSYIATDDSYKEFKYEHVNCKYCGYSTFKNEIGEYLLINNIKCLTAEEKIIKDLLE